MKIVIRNGANVNTHADGSAIHKKERRTLRGEIRGPPPPLLSGIPHPTASHKSLLVQAHRVSRTGCRKRGVGRASHSPRRVSSSFKFFTFFCVFFFFFQIFFFFFSPQQQARAILSPGQMDGAPISFVLSSRFGCFFPKLKLRQASTHTHAHKQYRQSFVHFLSFQIFLAHFFPSISVLFFSCH